MCRSIIQIVFILFAVVSDCFAGTDQLKVFAGKWSLESFRHELFLPEGETANNDVDLAVPWTSRSELDLNIDSKAKTVSGTLSIGDEKLRIDGNIGIDSTIGSPWISAIASLKAGKAVRGVTYKFKGYLVSEDHPCIFFVVVVCCDRCVVRSERKRTEQNTAAGRQIVPSLVVPDRTVAGSPVGRLS